LLICQQSFYFFIKARFERFFILGVNVFHIYDLTNAVA